MQIFICGWWLCPELYLRRPFSSHASARLDALLEAKAKQGVQVFLSVFLSECDVNSITILTVLVKLQFEDRSFVLVSVLACFVLCSQT